MTPAQISALQEEVRRLRKALEKISNMQCPDLSDNMKTRTMELGGLWAATLAIAKDALSSPSNFSKVTEAKEKQITSLFSAFDVLTSPRIRKKVEKILNDLERDIKIFNTEKETGEKHNEND